jgi:sugar phosphate isomerase/epimerase
MTSPRVHIGNQTSIHASHPLLPYQFAVQHGLDAFEWFSDKGRQGWCEDDMTAEARALLRQAAAEKGLRFSVHAPYKDAPWTADGMAALRRSLAFAADIGAAVVNLHLFTERGPEAFVEALRPLIAEAAQRGVRLSIENTPQTTPDDFNAVFERLAKVPEPVGDVVGMCLDMGHANLCLATRNDYLAYVDRLGWHVPIIHWHAHENWGDRDSHLPLFTGPSAQNDGGIRGLVQRLRARGFAGNVVLEQWPNPPELLLQSRRRLRELLDMNGTR